MQNPPEHFRVLRDVGRGIVFFGGVAAVQERMRSVEPLTILNEPTNIRKLNFFRIISPSRLVVDMR